MGTDLGYYDLPDWRTLLEPAYLLYEDGEAPGEHYYPCIRRRMDEKPKISAEEEYRLMNEQIEDTQGFDIDFTKFRCVFNYQPLDFDDDEIAMEPETTRELVDRLSRKSLEGFNEKYNTEYEFVKVVKANHHSSAGIMFFITFEGKQPFSDDKSKLFQARVCYCGEIYNDEYISCELKPEKKVHYIETAEKEDLKKPRLIGELSNVFTLVGGETQALMCSN